MASYSRETLRPRPRRTAGPPGWLVGLVMAVSTLTVFVLGFQVGIALSTIGCGR